MTPSTETFCARRVSYGTEGKGRRSDARLRSVIDDGSAMVFHDRPTGVGGAF
jgi:hypothetical protein